MYRSLARWEMKAVQAISSPNASSSLTSVTVMSGGFSGSVVDFSSSAAVGCRFAPGNHTDGMSGKFVSVVVVVSRTPNPLSDLCSAGPVSVGPVAVSVSVVSVAVEPVAVGMVAVGSVTVAVGPIVVG